MSKYSYWILSKEIENSSEFHHSSIYVFIAIEALFDNSAKEQALVPNSEKDDPRYQTLSSIIINLSCSIDSPPRSTADMVVNP